MSILYGYGALREFTRMLFEKAGYEREKAEATAQVLLEADLMGHSTHGLALVPWYLDGAAKGDVRGTGEPEVLSDRGACVSWNGRRLPGTWLTLKAIDLGLERVKTHGTCTIAIADSHHIGALAAYLPRATERGCMAIVASSSPAVATVAPYGGRVPVMTPDPIGIGIPTGADPILIDISATITTNNMARRLIGEGKRFPQPWALDAEGHATDDPKAVIGGGGSLLPVGGLDHGHKGYALGLLVEALTQGLGGFGRADSPRGASSCVFVQVIDPAAFAGQDAFNRQTGWLVEACRDNPTRPGVERVRVPGENAMKRRAEALASGVAVSPAIMNAIEPYARRLGLATPAG
jgi:LDH2 family malate/lactate/ureidoglycolate dehydrogenase